MPFSDQVKGYSGQNPFSDFQPRSFSDNKIASEFMPISSYWTLFNDQHEILLGARGCGKTFLLKMMRYSMVKTINNPHAEELIRKKEFVALYVPMHLEYVAPLNKIVSENDQIVLFQVIFNCLLGNAIITELKALLDEIINPIEQAKKQLMMIRKLDEVWFGEKKSELSDFVELEEKIDKIHYGIDWNNFDVTSIPVMFKNQICTPLLSVKRNICHILDLTDEPTWIVCVDEAEFLNKVCQKCINSVFRSDSNRIAIKMATLPFYHTTLETLNPEIWVSDGNDFSYKIVDMNYADLDFVALTDSLCRQRIERVFGKDVQCFGLKDFVGCIGNDDYIDYYRDIMGDEEASYEVVEKSIVEEFAPKRRESVSTYSNLRKTVYDKFAPIFFLRRVYKLSQKGHNKPGWYAGAKNIRKISQGNPRMFIHIMCNMFDKARETKLTTKAQHDVLYKFACDVCESTKALQYIGPVADNNLKAIAEIIQSRIHGGSLITGGLSFSYSADSMQDWIEIAIAHSRVIADDETKRRGVTTNSKLMLSNVYAVKYWLPMRSADPISVTNFNDSNSYRVDVTGAGRKSDDPNQLTLFEVMNDDANY